MWLCSRTTHAPTMHRSTYNPLLTKIVFHPINFCIIILDCKQRMFTHKLLVITPAVPQAIMNFVPSQISYSSMSNTLDDRVRFRNYFRTIPSLTKIVPAIRSVIELFGWKRITFLSQSDTLFSQVSYTSI